MSRQILNKPVVLVVEDEILIRLNLVQVAEDSGYEVLQASNVDGAIEILQNRDDIRAVLSDVRMPGENDGLRLARVIRRRWPPIALVLMSGLDIPCGSDFLASDRFIRKPYANGQIAAALQEFSVNLP